MEMEGNGCSVDHLESDVDFRLPPRKRLLAGLKKQNCESYSSSSSGDFGAHLSDLLSVDLKSSNLSPEEVVEASRSAALAAAEVAAAAKAAALEKAAVAVKAVAAAKTALELVASVSIDRNRGESLLRKNRPEKHVPVKLLYKGEHCIENHESDEELARKLHRAMNSSPRIMKNCVSSICEVRIHEKQREAPVLEKVKVLNIDAQCEGKLTSVSDRDAVVSNGNLAVPIAEAGSSDKLKKKGVLSTEVTDYFPVVKVPAGGICKTKNSTRKRALELEGVGVTHGRKVKIKRKKLSLNLCSKRDREKPKKEVEPEFLPSNEEVSSECPAENMPLLAAESPNECDTSLEAMPTWKQYDFTAPQCFTESKSNPLDPLCSTPIVATVSAMIKADD